ncbi:MAG: hypothetical protein ACM32E_28640 [Gemmatimonadota bacterium]
MQLDGCDPWKGLPIEEALRRVRFSITPRWEAWTVSTTDAGTIWCARRQADAALTHADSPGHLLQHIADADEALLDEKRWA